MTPPVPEPQFLPVPLLPVSDLPPGPRSSQQGSCSLPNVTRRSRWLSSAVLAGGCRSPVGGGAAESAVLRACPAYVDESYGSYGSRAASSSRSLISRFPRSLVSTPMTMACFSRFPALVMRALRTLRHALRRALIDL